MNASSRRPKGLILLVHEVHDGISDEEVNAALPEAWRSLPHHTARISPGRFQVQDSYRQDFHALQVEQERQYRAKVVPLREAHPDYDVVYFGFAHHCLALALGHLLEDVPAVHVRLLHHRTKTFDWPAPTAAVPDKFVGTEGLPASVLPDVGDVILRVSCSNTVSDEDAAAVGVHLADVHVRVKEPGEDCLVSSDHLEAVAEEFRQALRTIAERCPRLRTIHLLNAVPTGLAFRMGMMLKPSVTPTVRTYLYRRTETPRYKPLILVPSAPRVSMGTSAPVDDIRRQVARNQAVVFAGAGVSVATSENRDVAMWTGLIENGLDYCLKMQFVDAAWVTNKRDAIALDNSASSLISIAVAITEKLGGKAGGEYRRWLRESVGQLTVKDDRVAVALKALRAPLVTTNYDALLERALHLEGVTWKQRSLAERALRGDDERIVHVHGYFEDPSSVVLGAASYQEVVDDLHLQSCLRALFTLRTVIFVGYGAGLKDPNFGALLRWLPEVFSGSEYRHYQLVRNSEVEAVRRTMPPGARIHVVGYGDSYLELVPFLHSLV